jgi:hypothetical protein
LPASFSGDPAPPHPLTQGFSSSGGIFLQSSCRPRQNPDAQNRPTPGLFFRPTPNPDTGH